MLKRIAKAAATIMVAAAAFVASAAQAAGPPVIVDGWATNVTSTAAELKGVVDPGGSNAVVRIEYITRARYEANLGTNPPQDPYSGSSHAPAAGFALGGGESPVEFTMSLSGLVVGTGYRYRFVVTNASATVEGPAKAISTVPAGGQPGLPDGRRWEMVSPVEKGGGEIQGPGEVFGGGVFQAAAAGGAFTYSSYASFGEASGAPGASQYVSRRDAGGWSTANVTQPSYGGGYGSEPDGVPFQRFGDDLAKALFALPWACSDASCPRRFGRLDLASGEVVLTAAQPDLRAVGAAADLAVVILSTCAKLTADATEVPSLSGCEEAAPNLYRWTSAGLSLVNVLPGGMVGTPGARLAAPAGAVSVDGGRIYFTVAGNLYLRSGSETVQVDAGVGGGSSFEAASADGAVAYLTKGGHLYRYSGGGLTDLTPGGGVEGVLGTSPDGDHVYYVTAEDTFHRQGATTTAVGRRADQASYPAATGASRVGANGNLAFLATGEWPESDNGAHRQAYVYVADEGELHCASCNPSGIRSRGPAVIAAATVNGSVASASSGYRPRAMVAGGDRVFFESPDGLVLGDTNSATDLYQWEAAGVGGCADPGGCVDLISSGQAAGGARFLDASADGDEVYFVTSRSLVKADTGAADVYVAKAGGGYPEPSSPIPCLGDACQPIPGAPAEPVVATGVIRPEGNPPLRIVGDEGKKRVRRSKCRKHRKRGKAQAMRKRAAKRCAGAKKGKRRGSGKAKRMAPERRR